VTRPSAPGSVCAVFGLALMLLALIYPTTAPESGAPLHWFSDAWTLGAAAWLLSSACLLLRATSTASSTAWPVGCALIGALLLAQTAAATGDAPPAGGFWLGVMATALLAIASVQRWAALDGKRWIGPLTAALFGLWLLWFWQVLVTAFGVPRVLLPAPSLIAMGLADQAPMLWRDFVQTVGKAVLVGFVLGSGLGFLVGVAIDRVPFLQRGLLPVASLTSTVPLVAVAPIAVMWFGFEWPSKAAVVVLMTFFPMLVATLAGLRAAGKIERELMHSYAAGYLRTLIDLRLPMAVPHLMGALKVNASLALIGAIVAEFFGSPTVGIGFRISTEAARMNMPLVWASIVVAAVTGSLAYALLSALERRVAFWHPSVRG
jgi:NitT/TauT family transport system permease protein